MVKDGAREVSRNLMMRGLGYGAGLYAAVGATKTFEARIYIIRGMVLRDNSDYSMKTGWEGWQT